MIRNPHVVLAGGGTLGNLYPGLAIAEQLADLCPKLELTFVGGGEASEKHEALRCCHNYLSVPAQPTPRSPLETVRYVTDNTIGYWASRWLLGEKDASLVLGLGGPVSAVIVRAAHSRGVPFVLLEQDARASRTARVLGRYAESVCVTHPELQPGLPVQAPVVVSGTPVRPAFATRVTRPDAGPADEPREKQLLVLAGADTATATPLNQATVAAVKRIRKNLEGWRVVHQAGPGQLQSTEQAYQAAGVDALVVTQLDEIDTAFAASDLVVCRPGASTIAELAAIGLPSVLVSPPAASDPVLAANARAAVAAGGAVAVGESTAEPLSACLARQLGQILPNDIRRQRMSQAASASARPDAALRVAEICTGLLGLESIRAAA